MTRPVGNFPRPDFLADPDAASPWPRAVALGGGATLALLALVAWNLQREIDDIAIVHEAVAASARRAATDTIRTPGASFDGDGIRAAWRVDGTLGHPWNDLFSSLEGATPPGVSWLSFDHSVDTGRLHLEGSTSSIEAMLSTVDSLSQESEWSEVVLTGWEQGATAGGPSTASVLRFVVEARSAAQASPLPARQGER